MAYRILVVEDDPTLRLVLQDNLTAEGYAVDVAATGGTANKRTQTSVPDLILLDLTLPDCDGLDLLPTLHQRGEVPIIILTARGQHSEKLRGLGLGADDYITKPFNLDELLARIRAVLRRARRTINSVQVGEVTIDFVNKSASVANRSIPLTHREFELLSYLAERRGKIVHRDELLRAIWGYLDADITTRTVDFAIARLRKKIEADHHNPQMIRTAHGDGYYLVSGGADPIAVARVPGRGRPNDRSN
jgi:DNA-binding response OmpR family regulator